MVMLFVVRLSNCKTIDIVSGTAKLDRCRHPFWPHAKGGRFLSCIDGDNLLAIFLCGDQLLLLNYKHCSAETRVDEFISRPIHVQFYHDVIL